VPLWSIRFGVVCPLGLVVLCYSYVSSFERHWQLLVATLVLSATAGFIIMITAMPAPAMLRHRRFSRINSYPSPWRPTAEEFGQAFGFADFAG